MYSTVDSGLTYTYISLVVSLVVCDLLNSHLRRRGNETVEFRCDGGASWLGWRHRRRWFTQRRRTEGNKNVTSTAAGNCSWLVRLITGRARRLTQISADLLHVLRAQFLQRGVDRTKSTSQLLQSSRIKHGPASITTHIRLTAFFPGLPGWAGTRKVKPIWTVSGSGISWAICNSQITTPAPHHSVFYRPDALPAAQPTASKHWRPASITNLAKQRPTYRQRCRDVTHTQFHSEQVTSATTNDVLTCHASVIWWTLAPLGEYDGTIRAAAATRLSLTLLQQLNCFWATSLGVTNRIVQHTLASHCASIKYSARGNKCSEYESATDGRSDVLLVATIRVIPCGLRSVMRPWFDF